MLPNAADAADDAATAADSKAAEDLSFATSEQLEDGIDAARWAELEAFLAEKVPLWASGTKVQIADRSKGHSLVYTLATGQGGHNGAHLLYQLFVKTVAEVSDGRRRATERERHEKVVKPLAGSVFKYLDQLHVDKGGLPDLKTAAMMLWNDPTWTASDWVPERPTNKKNNKARVDGTTLMMEQTFGMVPGLVLQQPVANPHGSAGGAEARQRALKILKERQKAEANKKKDQPEGDDKGDSKEKTEDVFEEEFGEMSLEDMLAEMKEEGLSSFGTGTRNAVLDEGKSEASANGATGSPTKDVIKDVKEEVDAESIKKRSRSRGGSKKKKKR